MTDQTPAPAPQPAAPAYAPAAPSAPWNVLSIISLVASIVGFGIVGIITGHIALGQIKRTGEQGRVLALIGTILGYVAVGLFILFAIIWLAFIIMGIAATASNSNYTY